jgi:cobalamin biosynthesis protein CobT
MLKLNLGQLNKDDVDTEEALEKREIEYDQDDSEDDEPKRLVAVRDVANVQSNAVVISVACLAWQLPEGSNAHDVKVACRELLGALDVESDSDNAESESESDNESDNESDSDSVSKSSTSSEEDEEDESESDNETENSDDDDDVSDSESSELLSSDDDDDDYDDRDAPVQVCIMKPVKRQFNDVVVPDYCCIVRHSALTFDDILQVYRHNKVLQAQADKSADALVALNEQMERGQATVEQLRHRVADLERPRAASSSSEKKEAPRVIVETRRPPFFARFMLMVAVSAVSAFLTWHLAKMQQQ